MPKGVFTRPKPRGLARRATDQDEVLVPTPLEQACKNFESSVGGRVALIEHIAHAPLTGEQELLIGAIADPRNDQNSLARICYVYGIQFADLLTLFRAAGFAKAQLKAMNHVWNKLPDVASDVMDRSVPHYVRCAGCAGTGVVTKEKQDGFEEDGTPKITSWKGVCPGCNGACELLVQPKLETQKVALELGGLVSQGPGVQVNVTQQQAMGQGSGGGRLSNFYRDSDEVIFGSSVVDAEVVEEVAPPEPLPEPPPDFEA